ncbi:Alpha/beta hydrolase fold-1 [Infundibulicybe gibba]|nr:Alpha/beta hydrolase fold-1 [Infundibulicybe gibba]
MSAISSQSYVFNPQPNYPLLTTAKRYWKEAKSHDPEALTLIFAHGTGFHKEQWEPTIEDLYTIFGDAGGVTNIREVWSIDAPNHGDAAVLNEHALQWGYEPIFGWEEYARSLHLLLAGLGTGIDVDFSTHKLVAIGHSMGAVSLALALTYTPAIKFGSLILCEPVTMHQRFAEGLGEMLTNGAVNRRDIWSSREEAYRQLKGRPAWKVWDDRVLQIFVNDGMRNLPTADYPDKTEGVTLKCSRKQETACYRDPLGIARTYLSLGEIATRIPIHLVYGAIDYGPKGVKEDVINVASQGNLASVSRVGGAGHLIVQMNPKGLAERIHSILTRAKNGSAKL